MWTQPDHNALCRLPHVPQCSGGGGRRTDTYHWQHDTLSLHTLQLPFKALSHALCLHFIGALLWVRSLCHTSCLLLSFSHPSFSRVIHPHTQRWYVGLSGEVKIRGLSALVLIIYRGRSLCVLLATAPSYPCFCRCNLKVKEKMTMVLRLRCSWEDSKRANRMITAVDWKWPGHRCCLF